MLTMMMPYIQDPYSWGRVDIERQCPKCDGCVKSIGWADTKCCDVDGNFYLLYRRFRCNNAACRVEKAGKGTGAKQTSKSYTFSMISEDVINRMPADVRHALPIQAAARNHTGFHLTHKVIRLMVGLGGTGASSCAAFRKVVQEMHRRKYIDGQLRYVLHLP